MVERYKAGPKAPTAASPSPRAATENVYFKRDDLDFIPSGCTLLDCVLGGGWPLGRVVNIVGDRSTGKTLLAEEGAANLFIKYDGGKVWYRESEAAFDLTYAKNLGVPLEKINFGKDGPGTLWDTVEGVFDDLESCLLQSEKAAMVEVKKMLARSKTLSEEKAFDQAIKRVPPGLYIIDSLDSLSSEKELKRDIRKGSYNLDKPKLLGELFRTKIRRLKRSRVCVMFISQTRDRIAEQSLGPARVMGKQYSRSGGKSLDFYASIVLLLAEAGKIYKETAGGKIKRAIAMRVRAKCEKNKITLPYRDCLFPIRFGYGIDDDAASLEWLKYIERLRDAGFEKMPKSLDDLDAAKLKADTTRVWFDVEKSYTAGRGKYVVIDD